MGTVTVYWITGGTGLIGYHLVLRLVQAKQQLVVISRSAGTYFEKQKLSGLVALNYNIARDSVHSLPECRDDVVLIALASHITTSQNLGLLKAVLQADTIGHLRLLEHLRPKLRHVVYASSCTVYGWPKQLPVIESAAYLPGNIYALNKVAMELFLHQVHEQWCIPISILRIAQVYGYRANLGAAIYKFLDAAHRNESPEISVPPDTIRDYCHVSDVVQAILLAMEAGIDTILNVGGGDPITIGGLAKLCLDVTRSNREPIIHVESQKKPSNMWLDISRAKQLVGYTPGITLEDGIAMEYRRLYQETERGKGI